MKITPMRQNGSRAAAPASLGQDGKAPAIPFFTHLQQQEAEAMHKARLDKLYAETLALADRLSLASPLTEWEAFRQSVLAYLAEVKKHYLFRRAILPDRAGNHRLLVLVDQADRELVAMGLDFIDQSQDDLVFLDRLKRLKGLLLDMRS